MPVVMIALMALFVVVYVGLLATEPHPEWLWNVALGAIGAPLVLCIFFWVEEEEDGEEGKERIKEKGVSVYAKKQTA
jgi:hypothetical protein